jgi:hypothetical protein
LDEVARAMRYGPIGRRARSQKLTTTGVKKRQTVSFTSQAERRAENSETATSRRQGVPASASTRWAIQSKMPASRR